MPDNNDIIRSVTEQVAKSQQSNDNSLNQLSGKLDTIAKNTADLNKSIQDMFRGGNPSQSAARDFRNIYQNTSGYGNGSRYFDPMYSRNFGANYNSAARNSMFGSPFDTRNMRNDVRRMQKGFLDSLQDELLKGFLGSGFRDEVEKAFDDLAKQLGTTIDDVPRTLGRRLGRTALSALGNVPQGAALLNSISGLKGAALNTLSVNGATFLRNLTGPGGFRSAIPSMMNMGRDVFGAGRNVYSSATNFARWAQNAASNSEVLNVLKQTRLGGSVFNAGAKAAGFVKNRLVDPSSPYVKAAGQAITEHGTAFLNTWSSSGLASALPELGAMGGKLVAAGKGVLSVASKLGPEAAAAAAVAVAAVYTLSKAFDSLKLTVDAVKKVYTELKKVSTREITSRTQNVDYAKKRMEADYETMIKYPFELLEKAANSLYTSWSNNLTTVSATQGYDKSDVQDLMSVFAQRLRDEGLSKYISGSDMFDNLAQVLKSGLSGAIAEEFAYQATILNKAIPTQDFFSYASTYASIAANAVRAGQSQEEAIETANASLQSFANGLLYASRELSGGFTTGLQNAATLYEEAAKVAQASKSTNIAGISGTMLAVQSYVGAVAPDLATSITNAIYSTLTGGNSSNLVALRSLAGVNASNTEFLKAFASNPQAILSAMFDKLAAMYTDSADAYMEKAEGYAQLFGLSSEAFQRIDFAGLAEAIRSMNMSSSALSANMNLLQSGETTTTAEQLKAQQINQYMIDEGLAYVIDNEAAQLIQQHMWAEQQNRELMEATYSVSLTGAAMEALVMIEHAIQNVLNFINPLSWMKKVGNVVATVTEGKAQAADLRQMLELGKVGNGNARSLFQLTTRGQDLGVTRSLVELMGGTSAYRAASQGTKAWTQMTSPIFALTDMLSAGISGQKGIVQSIFGSSAGSGLSSKYSWGSISKSQASAASALLSIAGRNKAIGPDFSMVNTATGSAASASANAVKDSIDKMLAESYLVDQYVKKGKSYSDWAASASKYGISDLSSALTAAGYSESDIKNYFQDKETEQGVAEQQVIREEEKLFRDTGVQFWGTDFPTFKDALFIDTAKMIENQATQITNQESMITNQSVMITNQSTMIEKLGSIINNQVDWKDFFSSTWATWISADGAYNTYLRKAVIDDGWNSYFQKGWIELTKTGWNEFFNKSTDFFSQFIDHFINYTYYSGREGYSYSDVERIQAEKAKDERGDAVYALSEMLTKNLLDLKDPTVQTNTLLAQILIVVNAIKNQTDETNTGTATSTLAETLSALALGLTSSSDTSTPTTVT